MPLGPRIRRLFGDHEKSVADAYRRLYIDLDDFVATIRAWAPAPLRILEVGCGEGAVTERLASGYPDAMITAIDISPAVGRLYDGPANRVTFMQAPVERLAADTPGYFDLVVMCDVLHHVRRDERAALLSAIDRVMAPGASFVFKDWVPTFHPIHWLCWFADRYVTRDDVRFCTKPEIATLLTDAFGRGTIGGEAIVPPWRNNVAFLVQPRSNGTTPR